MLSRMNCTKTQNIGLLLMWVLLCTLASSPVRSDVLAEAETYSIMYNEDLQQTQGFKLKAGSTNFPVYGWASYEAPTIRFKGQALGDASIIGVGLGSNYTFNDRLSVFVELGYGFVDVTPNDNVVDEMVYTQLRQDHWYEGRYQPGRTSEANATYELDNAYIGRVGASWKVMQHVGLTASYRYMVATEFMNQWDGHEPSLQCGCWWQSDQARDFSGFEVGVKVSW